MGHNVVMIFKSEKELIVIRQPEKVAYLRKDICVCIYTYSKF
jgi:hypothetical protein